MGHLKNKGIYLTSEKCYLDPKTPTPS